MEKISKRKAVFRVEFQIYATTEEAHDTMCVQLLSDMVLKEQQFHYFESLEGTGGIDAVAKCKSARRLAR